VRESALRGAEPNTAMARESSGQSMTGSLNGKRRKSKGDRRRPGRRKEVSPNLGYRTEGADQQAPKGDLGNPPANGESAPLRWSRETDGWGSWKGNRPTELFGRERDATSRKQTGTCKQRRLWGGEISSPDRTPPYSSPNPPLFSNELNRSRSFPL
jgi:hypothetical protein